MGGRRSNGEGSLRRVAGRDQYRWTEWVDQEAVRRVDYAKLNAPMRVCAEGTDDELTVKFAVNRAYSLALGSSVLPDSSSLTPSVDAASLAYTTIGTTVPINAGDYVVAPARMITALTWSRADLAPGDVVINGRVTFITLAMDTVVTAAEALLGKVSEPADKVAALLTCLQGVLDTAVTNAAESVGTVTNAATACLDPIVAAVEAGATASAQAVQKAVTISLLAGRGAQTVLDASTAMNELHRVTLVIVGDMEPPPAGSTVLSDLLVADGGVGPSGEAASVIIDNKHAMQSTTQWVGCEGEPAWADYDLAQRTRLTGVLAKRDFPPEDVTVKVDVLVDGQEVKTYTMVNDSVPVESDLPAGNVLRLQGTVSRGVCGSAPAGYLVWGNGAVG